MSVPKAAVAPRPPSRPGLVCRATAGLAVVVSLLGAAGCSTTLGDLPLPGVGVSGDTIGVDAEFAEALNLAEGATVKVNGVDSGKVQDRRRRGLPRPG